MNWNRVYKSEEEGLILTETPRWKFLAGAEIRTVTIRPRFLALQPLLPYRIWPFSWLHTVGPHSSGQYSGGPPFSDHQQAVWNTVQTFPEPVRLERDLPPICLADMLPQRSPALVFVSSTRSSQTVSHPSTILAQCCLTSVFLWELVFPTWQGPLSNILLFAGIQPIKSVTWPFLASLIGQFQGRVNFFVVILFIGSGPCLVTAGIEPATSNEEPSVLGGSTGPG